MSLGIQDYFYNPFGPPEQERCLTGDTSNGVHPPVTVTLFNEIHSGMDTPLEGSPLMHSQVYTLTNHAFNLIAAARRRGPLPVVAQR